jgi:hypothetical protein
MKRITESVLSIIIRFVVFKLSKLSISCVGVVLIVGRTCKPHF